LVALIAENAKEDAFTHEEWSTRNPFDTTGIALPEGTASSLGDFQLQGIFWGSHKPSAIINNSVVAVGDRIKEGVVKEIKENTVLVLDAQGQEVALQLRK
jgi:hypothetical protein